MANHQSTQTEEKWLTQFSDLYSRASQNFSSGTRGPDNLFSNDDSIFLASIGATNQEIYDFIEDWIEVGEPDPQTVQKVTAIRRAYLLQEQAGIPSQHTILMKDLPSMSATLGGYRWLPRIIAKARAKLRGEMPPALMYGCGGDRPFLKNVGSTLEEFLQVVWHAQENDQPILVYVQQQDTGSKPS